MAFQLVIAEGKEAGREFVFEQQSVLIGRTSDCDVVLYDPGVSRKHARIFSESAQYFVEDMGSSNGTKVNGAIIKKKLLADGDAISLGPVVFNFAGLSLTEFAHLSEELGLHLFHTPRHTRYVIRRRYDASSVSSKRLRRGIEAQALAKHGERIVVYELQGELTLSSIERVIRDLLLIPPDVEYLIIDFKRVFGADGPAVGLWLAFLDGVRERYREVILTQIRDPALRARLDPGAASDRDLYRCMEETDAALERCEDLVLGERLPSIRSTDAVRLEDFDVCAGLDAARIAILREGLEPRRYDAGDTIIHVGEPADFLFFLMSGRVSVTIDLPDGGSRRLTTCTPGMLFGEMAILEHAPRSAAVCADGPVECYAMARDSFERLTATHPDLKVRLLENFARTLSLRLRRLTDEVRALND